MGENCNWIVKHVTNVVLHNFGNVIDNVLVEFHLDDILLVLFHGHQGAKECVAHLVAAKFWNGAQVDVWELVFWQCQ